MSNNIDGITDVTSLVEKNFGGVSRSVVGCVCHHRNGNDEVHLFLVEGVAEHLSCLEISVMRESEAVFSVGRSDDVCRYSALKT